MSLRIFILVRQLDKADVTHDVSNLESGQRQDSWLTAAIVWGVIALRDLIENDIGYVVQCC